MPKREEPSLRLMNIVWDIAATRGKDNIPAILRDLEYELEKLRKDEESDFCEDTPSERKIKQIIDEEINKMPPEAVISKLPRHVWYLRKDYDDILKLSEKSSTKELDLTEHRGLTFERPNPFHFLVKEIYDHDRNKFQDSNNILNEEKLKDFIEQLRAHEYYEHQVYAAREFLRFFHYESNKYINTNLLNLCTELCDALEDLCDFIEYHKIDEGRYYVVDPHDRFYADAEEYDKHHPEWEKFDIEFSQSRDTTYTAYKAYRAAVRETLIK